VVRHIDENDLLAFAASEPASALRAAIEAHLAECEACRRLFCAWARTSILAGRTVAAPIEPTPAIGRTVGRYVVLKQIGAGAMGIVYSAFDPDLERLVALKLLRPELAAERDAQAHLLREARLMARVRHPRVVAVHDVGLVGERVFIVVELVVGQDLTAWLAARQRTPAEIVRRFVEAGRGLGAAHQAGVIHRDFKPGNVLIDRAGHARVTDFGLAQAADVAAVDVASSGSQLETCLLAGTPIYMSPEQLNGGLVDARSDQFSFCVSLFEAIFCWRPFAGASVAQLRRAMRAPLTIPGGRRISQRVRRVLQRGLALRAADRYPSMAALLAELGCRPRRAESCHEGEEEDADAAAGVPVRSCAG